MRKAKEMRRLRDRLVGALTLPIPAVPDALFAELITIVEAIRGREIQLLKEEFPHRTASGLWLDLETRDVIVVDRRGTPFHQLGILFHEVWHMLNGDCGTHVVGRAVAARMLSARADVPDLETAVLKVAARTDFSEREERDAEEFALLAVTRCRVWLEGAPDSGPMDRGHVAGRIGMSLGHRRHQG
ncbi:toxin-antitoxin system, toxin component [Streptomyces sp. NPDC050704]|uniref:toxin-antitoxin system, toxin component n=1 Tax=Streptomyces sp. NPDC050704 TaxID=3157219 RepID=UPI00344AD325